MRSALALAGLLGAAAPAAAQTAILTHHVNNNRNGWNREETVLTPANVGTPGPQGTFGLLTTIPLDGVVDAQPLVVPGIQVAGDPNAGTHDVVYAATQNDTVYAIDPIAGTVLLSRNFGKPVAMRRGCGNPSPDIGVGITGTPVIDLKRHALYLIAYTNDPLPNGFFKQTYRLHALDLSTLADKVAPVVISANQTLTDGSIFTFAAGKERQRPALLETGNKIYAAFSSFCDNARARGWVLGWHADTLKPIQADAGGLPLGALTNRQVVEPHGLFLSAIWMSGAGPAADAAGIYYVTGNSDPSGTQFDAKTNTTESVVRLSLDTTSVLDVFAPSNLPVLEAGDKDFGAGGVTLLPSMAPGQPPMAAAAGKFGTLYLLDRTNLGGYTPDGPDKVVATATIGPCWCQPSFFNNGTPTLVTSGGAQLSLWTLQTSPTVALVRRATTTLSTGNPPGFFTSVSSHGPFDSIVWTVTRAFRTSSDKRIWLYAFGVGKKSTSMTQLFSAPAGLWAQATHAASTVPVVANGRVYVASDSGIAVFGLAPPAQ